MEEKKFCKFCGEMVDKEVIVCPKCGRQITVQQNIFNATTQEIAKSNGSKFYEQEWFMWLMLFLFTPLGIIFMIKFNKRLSNKTKIILTVIFSMFFIIGFFISLSSSYSNYIDSDNIVNNDNKNNVNENNNVDNNSNKKDSYSFNETFEFNDLEITIGNNYEFTTIDNKYSDYYNQEIIKLPIIVKNLSTETHSLNMFYYSIYGSLGTETSNIGGIYFDDNIDYAGDLRSGASYTKYIYILHDGDGTYAIEFDDWYDEKLVEFDIKK